MLVGIKEAQKRLDELIARAQKGEEVIISRRGKPIGQVLAGPSAGLNAIGGTK